MSQEAGLAGAKSRVTAVVRQRRRPQIVSRERGDALTFLRAHEVVERVEVEPGHVQLAQLRWRAPDQRWQLEPATRERAVERADHLEHGGDRLVGDSAV